MFYSIRDLSAGCGCIPMLIFTFQTKPSTFSFQKRTELQSKDKVSPGIPTENWYNPVFITSNSIKLDDYVKIIYELTK